MNTDKIYVELHQREVSMKFFDYRMLAKRSFGLVCICLLAVTLLLPLLRSSSAACSRNNPGIIDLTGCPFNDSLNVNLDGKWEFYWNQLLSPFSIDSAAKPDIKYIPVPAVWSSLPHGEAYPKYGAATYKLLLILPSGAQDYALKVSSIRTASIVYVNGERLGGSGQPGVSRQNTNPQNAPYIVQFKAPEGRAEIVIQASNFTYTNGGIANSIQVGTSKAIQRLEQRNRTYDTIRLSGFAFMGFYFLGQGLQRKEDRPSLELALFCIALAVYLITHSEKLLFNLIPTISYEWFSKLQILSTLIGCYSLCSYTYSLFPKLYSRWMLRIALGTSFIFCIFTLLSQIHNYSQPFEYFLALYMLPIGYAIYVMIRAALHKEIGSSYLLISIFALGVFSFSLFANLALGSDLYSTLPVAGPIFVLTQGLFISTRHAHAYETIKELSQQLERKDKDKDEFLLKISNELRTPLNAIINISLSLFEGANAAMSPSQREDIRLILGTGRRLAFLVRDILDYEQIRGQRIKLYWKPIDIQGVANIVIEVFQFLNKKGEIRIKNRIPPGVFIVEADEHRLMQVLYNLLDNALKFTDRGSVVFEAEQIDDYVHVSVTDTGRGIPKERLESIFRDYEQVNEADSLENGGLGLGLAISRKLIELHGGMIEVSSTLGRGSCFTFTIPFSQQGTFWEEPEDRQLLLTPVVLPIEALVDGVAFEESAATTARTEDVDYYAPRILIVDDDYANLKALTNLLSLENYIISSARSGTEALTILTHERDFDLCILDVMMPEMSGLELCRIIRRTYSPLDLPILMATAGQQLHFNEAAFSAGANDFIHKPYAWSDLKGRVKTLVQLRRSVSDRLDSEISMLRAQIKPHFLYNAINTIIWMSSRDNDKTRQLLYDLSHFLRGSFDFGNQETAVPFEKELELIEAYLSLEKARFGKRLTVQYDIGISEFSLPPLIVQPIVENAVRHGLMEKIDGGTVILATRRVGDQAIITVSDNGKGMSDDKLASLMKDGYVSTQGEGTGIGLKNINRRLLKQFGQPLQIARGENGGIEVQITIPWKGDLS